MFAYMLNSSIMSFILKSFLWFINCNFCREGFLSDFFSVIKNKTATNDLIVPCTGYITFSTELLTPKRKRGSHYKVYIGRI